ncbi:required for meiotic nuclear division protein 1 homolog [Halyomorpha halys]|uniref:required for meiotic nuclear division protein 1 homolog n=1 Tax=Halyomorpha halys TaxID=286706 RepID=UPI0006D50C5B|nr:sad1-interacting factor 2-like [Halyomorpha halys]
MQMVELNMFKLDKWLGLKDRLSKLNRHDYPVDGILKKHRKYIKRWKSEKQLKVHKENCLTLAAYATADHYDLGSVLEEIQKQDRYIACEVTNNKPLATDICNAVHLMSRSLNGTEDSHVFCFDVGTVVMWNLTHGQREEMLQFLERFEQHPYGFNMTRASSELLAYKYAESRVAYLYDNTLYFGVAEKDSDLIGLNRFLISSALSLSTKVSVFENMIERDLCGMEKTATRIKAGKSLIMKQKQILRIAGVTYSTKYNLKHSKDSLLLPCKLLDYFKSDDERESFTNACLYFSLPQRLELFDNNMVLCECYVNLLLKHLSYRQNLLHQKIMLTVIGVGGICFLFNIIKKIMF